MYVLVNRYGVTKQHEWNGNEGVLVVVLHPRPLHQQGADDLHLSRHLSLSTFRTCVRCSPRPWHRRRGFALTAAHSALSGSANDLPPIGSHTICRATRKGQNFATRFELPVTSIIPAICCSLSSLYCCVGGGPWAMAYSSIGSLSGKGAYQDAAHLQPHRAACPPHLGTAFRGNEYMTDRSTTSALSVADHNALEERAQVLESKLT